jgi:hypothetical protein
LDLLTLLRKQSAEHPELLTPLGLEIAAPGLTRAAAA